MIRGQHNEGGPIPLWRTLSVCRVEIPLDVCDDSAPRPVESSTRPLVSAPALVASRPPLLATLPPTFHHSLAGVFLALGHDFGTENLASRTLFTTPANRCHRLSTFFLLTISTTYALGPLLTPHPSRMLVRGPESEISEARRWYFCHFLPLALAWTAGNAVMSHNSEDLTTRRDTPIAAALDCQTTAR